MNVVVTMLKIMVLALGLLMLVGGGLCGVIMVAEIAKTSGGGWEILIVAVVVTGIGWVLTRAMFRTLRQAPATEAPETLAPPDAGDDGPGAR